MAEGDVLIDTSAWIDFFTRPHSKAASIVDQLLKEGGVVTTGIVVAEILSGTRTSQERELLLAKFQPLTHLDIAREDWVTAGFVSAGLRRSGISLPLSDIVIAIVAQAHGCLIYTTDSHFLRIPNIRLFQQ